MFNPDFASNYSSQDIEGIFNSEYKRHNLEINEGEMNHGLFIFNQAIDKKFYNHTEYRNFIKECNHNVPNTNWTYNKIKLYRVYRVCLFEGKIERNYSLEKFMALKAVRGQSGVNVVTIFTSPTQFGVNINGNKDSIIKGAGCPMDCHYCPFEKDENGIPTQPRSYLSTEPGNMRATQNKHHPAGQTFDRLYTLECMGHISSTPDEPSKCEFIISGGTFNFYPREYLEWFVTCMYYACNIYYNWREQREMLSLAEEQRINENSPIRIIGLTIETRPDYVTPVDPQNPNHINLDTIQMFRDFGITRVQIGVQHIDNGILQKVNRKCTDEDNMIGIRRLKQNGFKTDIHLMLDLPGSTPEIDKFMLDMVLVDPGYQADQWKIYPTETTPFTKIKEWYDLGLYKPYAEIDNGKQLIDVLCHVKSKMHPWIRINRVIRDIPNKSIEGGIKCSNLRQYVDEEMRKNNQKCRCIRCREVKLADFNPDDIHLKIRNYESSSGKEYFISYESMDEEILYGFVRLRLNTEWNDVLPSLHGCAMIRELHVYGFHTNIGNNENPNSQHRGLGKKLLKKAEEIAIQYGYKKMSVISGVGVKNYYRKFRYEEENTYMTKVLIEVPKVINVVSTSANKYHNMLKVILLIILFNLFVWFITRYIFY